MNWFRSNVRLGSRLALLALAIQFLLSFGHVHGGNAQAAGLPGAKQSGLHRSIGLAAKQPGGFDTALQASVATPIQQKSTHDPDGKLGDACPICAVMSLANFLVVTTPPGLAAPLAAAFAYVTCDAGFADLEFAPAAFQPRAPPAA